jgi:hypothetical protein
VQAQVVVLVEERVVQVVVAVLVASFNQPHTFLRIRL